MKLKRAEIRNFRRLDHVKIDFEDKETIFVGPNNSGKTSATSVFRCFLGKRAFNIYDFPIAKLVEIDAFNLDEREDGQYPELPTIGLDLWFSLDPESVEFARVVSLISELDEETAVVGIGLTLQADDPTALWRDYSHMFPANDCGDRRRTLCDFLGLSGNLKRYFSIQYESLNTEAEVIIRHSISPAEGNRTVRSLLRADFIDAQRNMQDDEETSRGSKLSSAFASYYKGNIQPFDTGEEAVRIVDENNSSLTEHYKSSFGELMSILKRLGVPSANERELEVRSILSAEDALRGTTDLFYKDQGSSLSLPEAYNGLGFKNLVQMAVQIRDCQKQWANTEEDRPLCHVIFVEEPEVHLHAQVQQTFISNMWMILDELSAEQDALFSTDRSITPQLLVTTHSSHVLNSVEFEKVRYFRRCRRDCEDPSKHPLLSVSQVHDLGDFMPVTSSDDSDEKDGLSSDEALTFLKRYITLTHCDLMFADAAILIEGTVERLLLPAMIKQAEPNLSSTYLTILEIGGAYAHVFADLMRFLHIPYLVITDIDSVEKQDGAVRAKACSASKTGALTSNAALKRFFPEKTKIYEFNEIDIKEKIHEDGDRCVVYQTPQNISHNGTSLTLHGRTLEEALIYENLSVFSTNEPLFGLTLPDEAASLAEFGYSHVKNPSFKKTEFALRILALGENSWTTPVYIREGLNWLAARLEVNKEEASISNGA